MRIHPTDLNLESSLASTILPIDLRTSIRTQFNSTKGLRINGLHADENDQPHTRKSALIRWNPMKRRRIRLILPSPIHRRQEEPVTVTDMKKTIKNPPLQLASIFPAAHEKHRSIWCEDDRPRTVQEEFEFGNDEATNEEKEPMIDTMTSDAQVLPILQELPMHKRTKKKPTMIHPATIHPPFGWFVYMNSYSWSYHQRRTRRPKTGFNTMKSDTD